jgi:hypothetical protein
VGGGGEGRGFSFLLESHMTYLAGSHILRSWPGIRLRFATSTLFTALTSCFYAYQTKAFTGSFILKDVCIFIYFLPIDTVPLIFVLNAALLLQDLRLFSSYY